MGYIFKQYTAIELFLCLATAFRHQANAKSYFSGIFYGVKDSGFLFKKNSLICYPKQVLLVNRKNYQFERIGRNISKFPQNSGNVLKTQGKLSYLASLKLIKVPEDTKKSLA